MSVEVKLNFYDEVVVLNLNNKSYKEFKTEIGNSYKISNNDVDELIVYYFDSDKVKNFIKNSQDYTFLIGNSKKFPIIVYLEIHEESRLFKQNLNDNTNTNVFNNNNSNTNSNSNKNSENNDILRFSLNAEKIQKEIKEKQKLLEETIAKEREELIKKKEEAKKKAFEDIRKKKLEELRKKKLLMEKEEEDRKKQEKEELSVEVNRIMNEKLEKVKSLMDNTIKESLLLVDKQMEKRLQMSQRKDIHINTTCSSCGQSPIVGFRYSCGVVPDFNLCESCESLVGDAHPYPLIKYRNCQQSKMNFKIIIENANESNTKQNNYNNKYNKFDSDFNESTILFEKLGNNK